jgi:Domain of unknown function (DUF4267)
MGLAGTTLILAMVLAAILALLGILFLFSPSRAFAVSGHENAALPGVMGGRYFGLAALIFGLLWLEDLKALTLAFFIGAGFGFLDAFLTLRAQGKMLPHLLAGLVSLGLALAFWSIA